MCSTHTHTRGKSLENQNWFVAFDEIYFQFSPLVLYCVHSHAYAMYYKQGKHKTMSKKATARRRLCTRYEMQYDGERMASNEFN